MCPNRVPLAIGREVVEVMPLWICVHQQHRGAPTRSAFKLPGFWKASAQADATPVGRTCAGLIFTCSRGPAPVILRDALAALAASHARLRQRQVLHLRQRCGRRLYESICPLDEATVAAVTAPLEPFCTEEGGALVFSDCDHAAGPWRSYFIGIVGCLAPDEVDVLWPNQARPQPDCAGP